MTSDTEAGESRAVVAVFTGELDAADSRVDDELGKLLREGASQVVADLTNVTFVDSSVVRALVAAYRELAGRGGWLRVVYTHHLIRRVIEICGLAEVFPQYPSVEGALRGASAARAADIDGTSELGGS